MPIAQVQQVQQSYLGWLFSALGPAYIVLLLFAALVGFVLTLIVVIRGRGPMSVAVLLLAPMMPILVGLYGAMSGTVASFAVISMAEAEVKSSEIFGGIAEALVRPMIGMTLAAPIFLLALFGALVRSFKESPKG